RAGYGVSGNQSIGNYKYLSTFAPSGSAIFNNTPYKGIAPTRIKNPNLQWESTTEFDIGLDYGIFNGRVNGSFDYYRKKTSNMLVNKRIPPSSGFNSKL